MSVTSTTDELRKAAAEARGDVLRMVEAHPDININELYEQLASKAPTWTEPAVRTAIWDLIAEHRLIVRGGNALRLAGV